MTPFFFSQITDNKAVLNGEEARHCVRVMRKKAGDRVVGVDGRGCCYVAKITAVSKREVELDIEERRPEWGEKPQALAVLVSPLHKPDRFEWLVEKAVELGVTQITPYIGKHTVKTGLRLDRLERIMIAALKQCMRSRLPSIAEPVALEDALADVNAEVCLVAHAEGGKPLRGHGEGLSKASSAALLIGPEGDFSPEELEAAENAGFSRVTFGENRLRSETAAIHLISLVKHYMGY